MSLSTSSAQILGQLAPMIHLRSAIIRFLTLSSTTRATVGSSTSLPANPADRALAVEFAVEWGAIRRGHL
jgi:hypothetical protein